MIQILKWTLHHLGISKWEQLRALMMILSKLRLMTTTQLETLCSDGVATNSKAARVLHDMYGLHTPEYPCSAPAASGTIKRFINSKSMNVPEVNVHYECLQKVVKHFETSVKNKELLDDAMVILKVKPLHLVYWCNTRMGHFLKAEAIFDDMLPAA